MKRKLTYLLPGLALLVALPASSAEAPAPATAHVAVIVEDAEEALESLNAALSAAREAFMERYNAASEEDKPGMVPDYYKIGDSFTDRFLALAAEYPGTSEGRQALEFVLTQSTQSEARDKAMTAFLEHHGDDTEALTGLARTMLRASGATSAVRQLMAHAGLDADGKAIATYALAMQLKHDAEEAESDKARAKASAECIALLEACKAFDEVEMYPGYKTIAVAASGELYEMQHLQIGMVAPDIEGEDLDGIDFKLSDYRGKVVMLDFWGDW